MWCCSYYRFNPADERLSKLQSERVVALITNAHNKHQPRGTPLSVMDIGCNTGELTVGLHELLQSHFCDGNVYTFGVDVDPHLISLAKKAHAKQPTSKSDADGTSTKQAKLDRSSSPPPQEHSNRSQCVDFDVLDVTHASETEATTKRYH